MRIRHERSSHGHRQQTGFLHLHHRIVFKPFAPLAIFDRLRARRRRRMEQRLREFTPQRVVRKGRRIGDNGGDFLVESRLVAAAENEFGNKIHRPPSRHTQRHTEADKISSVHQKSQRQRFNVARISTSERIFPLVEVIVNKPNNRGDI
jgi:hypothetical protein